MKIKKIIEVLIGSNNKGKVREIRALLPKKVKIFTTRSFNLSSPKETGKTFLQNSLIGSLAKEISDDLGGAEGLGNPADLLGGLGGLFGGGGEGGGAHSLDEWWLNKDGYKSIQLALLILLSESGIN